MDELHGFLSRPGATADLDGIVALLNASSQDTRGADVTADHWQKRHWHESGINLETDSKLVTTPEGQLVGYIELTSEAPYVVVEMTGAVQPAYREQGIGSFLLQWAEQRARQDMERAPENARVLIHSSLYESNKPRRRLLAAHGFESVRRFIHLRIEMDSPPPEPVWPEGIVVRPLQSGDWKKVGPALSEAFSDHWGIVDYQEAASSSEADEPKGEDPVEKDTTIFNPEYFNSPGLCFVAWDGDEVVGSCLCNAKIIEDPDAGYLGSLSVRRPWRGRGIGLALTTHALGEFYRRGTRIVLTDTDRDSFTRANLLYPKAGMSVYTQEVVYEKEIRSGQDLLKRRISSSGMKNYE